MTSSCSSGMMRGRLVRLLRLTALLTVVGIIASYKTAPRPHREGGGGPQHDPIFVTHHSNTARKSFARPRRELHTVTIISGQIILPNFHIGPSNPLPCSDLLKFCVVYTVQCTSPM